jgi:hypothetical protein
MSLIPFAPFTQGYSQRLVKDCQADDFHALDVQGVTDAFPHEEQRTLLANSVAVSASGYSSCIVSGL